MKFIEITEKIILYCAIAIGVPIIWILSRFLMLIFFLFELIPGMKVERIEDKFARLKALLPGDTAHPEQSEICFAMLEENLFHDQCEMAFYDLVYIAHSHFIHQTPIDRKFCAAARKLGEEMLAVNQQYFMNTFIHDAFDMLNEIESVTKDQAKPTA